jgi:hypothetical protein
LISTYKTSLTYQTVSIKNSSVSKPTSFHILAAKRH